MSGTMIRELRKSRRLTQAQLGKELGVSAAAVTQWETGDTEPAGENLKKLASFFGVTMDEIVKDEAPVVAEQEKRNEISPGPEAPDRFRLPKDVKVLGISECGPNGKFVMDHNDAIDYARRPPGIANAKDVFCIHLTGDSMEPYFKAGELVYLTDRRPPQVGGLVVVELHSKNDGEPGPSMFKALVRRTAEYVELQQANPDRKFKVPMKDVKKIYRVLTNAELWSL